MVSTGSITSMASRLGTTRKRTGLMPMTRSASISLLIVMVPSRAARAEPERPATRMAVISGANSRVTDSATPNTTWCSAPNCSRVLMPWIASMIPIVSDSIDTMGTARIPISIISEKTDTARTGWRRRRPRNSQYSESVTRVAPKPRDVSVPTLRRPRLSRTRPAR